MINHSNKGLVSIGLPVVKTEFLAYALACCFEQTYSNFEVILVNNGKTPEVRMHIKEVASTYTDSRLKYFENESQIPMVANWNRTLGHAAGEFFTILCDDDKWHPDFIQEMVNLAQKYSDTNIFHSRVISIDESGRETGISPICPEYEDGIDFLYHRLAGFRTFYLSDFFLRTKAINAIGGFVELPDGWGSDDVTWYKMAMSGGIGYSARCLFYYRISAINISNNSNIRRKLQAVEMQHSIISDLLRSQNTEGGLRFLLTTDLLKNYVSARKMPLRVLMLNRRYYLPLPIAKVAAFAAYYLTKRK